MVKSKLCEAGNAVVNEVKLANSKAGTVASEMVVVLEMTAVTFVLVALVTAGAPTPATISCVFTPAVVKLNGFNVNTPFVKLNEATD